MLREEIMKRIQELTKEAEELRKKLHEEGLVSRPTLMLNILEMKKGKTYVRQGTNTLCIIKDSKLHCFQYGMWDEVTTCNPNERAYIEQELKQV